MSKGEVSRKPFSLYCGVSQSLPCACPWEDNNFLKYFGGIFGLFFFFKLKTVVELTENDRDNNSPWQNLSRACCSS